MGHDDDDVRSAEPAPGPGETVHLGVTPLYDSLSLDEFLCLRFLGYSKFFLRKLIHSGQVQVGGEECRGRILAAGEAVQITFPADKPASYVPLEMNLRVLHEDEHVIFVDKPAKVPTVPEQYRDRENLYNGLLAHFAASHREDSLPVRPRIIHRLDKETSGVLVVAKSPTGEKHLSRQFRDRTASKRYLAYVLGEVRRDEDLIEAKIVPHPHDTERMAVTERSKGRPSETRIRVVERFRGYTLVEATPLTGRTHQIRVHMSHYGHPLIVDSMYGGRHGVLLSELKPRYKSKTGREEKPIVDRLTLHSHELTVNDPVTEEPIVARVDPPKDLSRLGQYLAKYRALR